jgi:hypothetical protein
MMDIGSKEFMAATMTDEELDAEFNWSVTLELLVKT